MNKILLLFLISIAELDAIHAQQTGARPFPPSRELQQSQDTIDQEILEDLPPDTVRIYSPYQLKLDQIFDDTSLTDIFHQYEAIRLQRVPYLNLGNNGSSARPAVYTNFKRQGLDLGSHMLDVYKLKYEDLKLYDSKRPFFSGRVAQKSLKQEDLQLEWLFSKTFQNGLHLNVQLASNNYKGEFQEQITKNRNANINFWYHSPKGNYDLILNYLNNDMRQQDHGGIARADSILKIPTNRQEPSIIDDFPINGRTRQHDHSFSIHNGFNLKWKGTTLGASHRIALRKEFNTYLDIAQPLDSLYYGRYFSFRDTQQIDLRANGLVNEFRLDGIIKQSSYLMAGLKHEYYATSQSRSKSNLNLLSLIGQYNQTIAGNFHLSGEGQWGLLENLGEFYIYGQIKAQSRKFGSVEGHAIFQRSPVPLIYRQLYNFNKLIYVLSFEKPLTNQIGGSLNISSLAFMAGLEQSIITNTIYLNAARIPQQEKSAISITSVYGDKTLHVGKFHSHHRLSFQFNTNQDVLRLPAWFTQNVIYYQDRWFKNNLFFQIGLDSRVLPSFKTQSYFPFMGNFYNPVSPTVAFHPALEFFFNFQLRNFRGFFKMEGLEYYLYPTGTTFFETYDQPLFRTNFRLGGTWVLRD